MNESTMNQPNDNNNITNNDSGIKMETKEGGDNNDNDHDEAAAAAARSRAAPQHQQHDREQAGAGPGGAGAGAERGTTGSLFPSRLYRMLEEEARLGNTDIISWSPDGRSFQVHDRTRFGNELMPRYFGSSKFRTFQKNLNLWGFHTVLATLANPHRGEISNVNFIRGFPERCKNMKRVVKSKARREEQVEQYYESLKMRAEEVAAAAAAAQQQQGQRRMMDIITDNNINNCMMAAISNSSGGGGGGGGANLMIPSSLQGRGDHQAPNDVKMPARKKPPYAGGGAVSSPRQMMMKQPFPHGAKRSSSVSSSRLHDTDSPLVKHIRLGDLNNMATTASGPTAASTSASADINMYGMAPAPAPAPGAQQGRGGHPKRSPPVAPLSASPQTRQRLLPPTTTSSTIGQNAANMASLLELLSSSMSNEAQQQQPSSDNSSNNNTMDVASTLLEHAKNIRDTVDRNDALHHRLQALIGSSSQDNAGTTAQTVDTATSAENALLDEVHRLLGRNNEGDGMQQQEQSRQRRSSLFNSTSVSDAISSTENALMDEVQTLLGRQHQQRRSSSMYDSSSSISIPVDSSNTPSTDSLLLDQVQRLLGQQQQQDVTEPRLLDQVQQLLSHQRQQDTIQPPRRASMLTRSNNIPTAVRNNSTTGNITTSGASNTASDELLLDQIQILIGNQQGAPTQAQEHRRPSTALYNNVASSSWSTGASTDGTSNNNALLDQLLRLMGQQDTVVQDRRSSLHNNTTSASDFTGNNATTTSGANNDNEELVDQVLRLLRQPQQDHNRTGLSSLMAAAGEGRSEDPLTIALLGQLGQQSQRPPVAAKATTSSNAGNDLTAALLDQLTAAAGEGISDPSTIALLGQLGQQSQRPPVETKATTSGNAGNDLTAALLDQLTAAAGEGISDPSNTALLGQLGQQSQRSPVEEQATTSTNTGNDVTAAFLEQLGIRGLPYGTQSQGGDLVSSLLSNPSAPSLPPAVAATVPATSSDTEELKPPSSTRIAAMLDQLDASGNQQQSSGLSNAQTTAMLEALGRQIHDEQERILQGVASRRRQTDMGSRGVPSTVTAKRRDSSSTTKAGNPRQRATAPNTNVVANVIAQQFDHGRLHGQQLQEVPVVAAAASASLLRREQPQQEPTRSVHQTAARSAARRGDGTRRSLYLNDSTGNRSLPVGARVSEQDSSSAPPSLSNGGTISNTESGTGSGSGTGTGSSGEGESGSAGSSGEGESGSAGSSGEADSGSGSSGEDERERRPRHARSRSYSNDPRTAQARRLERSQSSSSPETYSNSGSNSNTDSASRSGRESSRRGGDSSSQSYFNDSNSGNNSNTDSASRSGRESSRRGGDSGSQSYLNDPSSVQARRLEQSQTSSSPESIFNSGNSSNSESTSGEDDEPAQNRQRESK